MRVINLEQNSKDWAAWRKKGLGASDAPVIMGVSPWSTPFQLWTELTGLCERPEANPFAVVAMQRGHDLEPKARALAEAQLGMSFPAVVGQHDTHEYIRASLDGYNSDNNTLLEIKCPGKADHATAVKGEVPKKYYPQLQQQFLVTGATRGWYFSWDGVSDKGVAIEVFPEYTYIQELEQKLIAFWGRIQMSMPPPPSDKDLERLVGRLQQDMKRVNNSVKALELLAGA